MAKRKTLSEKDIDQLLGHYRAERRRLSFQLENVRAAIVDLKKAKNALPRSAAGARPDAPVKRKPGRPSKSASAPAAKKRSKRGPGRPPKRVRPPRPLNEWDGMVMGAVRSAGKLMTKEELLAAAKQWAGSKKPGMKAAEVEAHLTRTLQKLSGRKKMLGTHHSGLRRGYHYGLMDWFFASSGKLRKTHYDKLILAKD
ncbi:MAG: hypothetical protein JNL05_13595 [Flavobacteriales bacterium]|nr:hypothetical protein [Flavobacteriales bacterium]